MYPTIPGSPGPSALTGPPSRDALGPRCPQQPVGTGGLSQGCLTLRCRVLCALPPLPHLSFKMEQQGNRALLTAAPPCVQLTKRSLTLPKVPPGNDCTPFSGRGYLLMVLRGHHIPAKRTEELFIRKTALINLLTYRDNQEG